MWVDPGWIVVCVGSVYSSVVNDKYGGLGGGIDQALWLGTADGT